MITFFIAREPAVATRELCRLLRSAAGLPLALLLSGLVAVACAAGGEEAPPERTPLEDTGAQDGGAQDEGDGGSAPSFGIANERRPREGLLFGGQPTEEQLRAVAADGYSVVNLRMPDEDAGFAEPAVASELGVDYRTVPVNREALEQPETYRQFYRALEETSRPTLVHCASGNRVGALYYAYLVEREGMDREEALSVARENGLRSDALVEAVGRYLDQRP